MLFPVFLNFLNRCASPAAVDVPSLKRTIAGKHVPAMNDLLQQMRDFEVLGDPVRYIRGTRAKGANPDSSRYAAASFRSSGV